MPKVQISGGLFACLIAVYLPIAQSLFLPAPLVKTAGQEAWIALLLAAIAGTVLVGMPAVWLATRHPGMGPAQIARQVLGKWAGGAVALVYIGLLTYIFGLCLRDIIDFTQMVLLPGTPGLVIIMVFGLICLYGAWHGLEPMVRVAFQAAIFIAVTAFVVPLLQLREISIKNVDPFLYRGWGGVLRGAFIALPWWTEMVSVMGLLRHMKEPRKAWRWLGIGMLGAVLPLTALTLHTTLALGSELPGRFLYPIYIIMQLISVAKIVERIEVLIITVFITGMFIKSGLYLFLAAEATASTFGLEHHHWPAVTLAVVGAGIAHVWGSTLNLLYWEGSTVSILIRLGVEIGIPALLLAASYIRRVVRGQERVHA